MAKSRAQKKRRPGTKAPTPAAGTERRRRRLPVILATVAVVVLTGAFALYRLPGLRPWAPAAGTPEIARKNVLLITLDTTRADRLGAYGYQPARTRHIDQLAREGVRFEHAYSPAPITLPAHASILTGLYPFAHGVRNNGNFYLDDRFPTLATILEQRGYRTAAFVSAFILDRRYGLARGFKTYDDRMEGEGGQVLNLEAERRGDRTAVAIDNWLRAYAADRSAPFFVWLHLYDPHEPYRAPAPFGPAFAGNPYDGEVSFVDAIVASVMDRLADLGLSDSTLVVIVGDHGESLGEHGEQTHSMFVYDAVMRVPFIVWGPGVVPASQVVQQPVRLTDVAPTILDLVGAPPLATAHGRSLAGLIRGDRDEHPPAVYGETLFPQLYMNWAPIRSLRDERWKFIEAPRAELYDTVADAAEARNVYGDRPDTARSLQREMSKLTGGSAGEMTVGRLDRETLDKLAALGYVGAGAEPSAVPNGNNRSDPKDMIGVFNRLRAANSAVRSRRFKDAMPILHEVLARDPRNAFAQLVLGSAYMGMGNYSAAIEQYRKYLEMVPTSSYAHQWMAICYLRLEDRDSAVREADAALAIDRHFTDARVLKAGILAGRGQYPAALAELRAAVNSDPGKGVIRLDLARVLAEAGHDAEAESEYQAALRLQPDNAAALIGLGALYAKQSKYGEAVNALQRALAVAPRATDARFNLAKVFERQGRLAEARDQYQQVIDSSDTSPAVRAAARDQMNAIRAR